MMDRHNARRIALLMAELSLMLTGCTNKLVECCCADPNHMAGLRISKVYVTAVILDVGGAPSYASLSSPLDITSTAAVQVKRPVRAYKIRVRLDNGATRDFLFGNDDSLDAEALLERHGDSFRIITGWGVIRGDWPGLETGRVDIRDSIREDATALPAYGVAIQPVASGENRESLVFAVTSAPHTTRHVHLKGTLPKEGPLLADATKYIPVMKSGVLGPPAYVSSDAKAAQARSIICDMVRTANYLSCASDDAAAP